MPATGSWGAPPPPPPGFAPTPGGSEPPKGGKGKVIAIVAIVALLLAGIGGAAFALSSGDDEKADKKETPTKKDEDEKKDTGGSVDEFCQVYEDFSSSEPVDPQDDPQGFIDSLNDAVDTFETIRDLEVDGLDADLDLVIDRISAVRDDLQTALDESDDEFTKVFEDLDAELSGDQDMDDVATALDDFAADECDSGSNSTTVPEDDEEASNGDFGSRNDPIVLGTVVTAGDWDLVVTGYSPSAFDQILAVESSATAPAPPNSVGIANVMFTYNGNDSSSVGFDFSASLLLSTSTTVDTGDDPCFWLDTNILFNDVFEGGSVTAPYCFVTETTELGGSPILILEFTDPDTFERQKIFMGL